jgi:hypothetical protein
LNYLLQPPLVFAAIRHLNRLQGNPPVKPSFSAKTAFAPGLLAALLLAACQTTKQPAPVANPNAIASAQGSAHPAALAQTNAAQTNPDPNDPIVRIKDQGLTTNSQAMATLSYLTDVIGQRLTASPNARRANEWTKMKLESWGLANAHLEPWGPFGRGWELKHFSAQIVEPQVFPLIACPQAWSPGLDQPLTANLLYMGDVTTNTLDSYKGRLAGAIVLVSPMRQLLPRFEPLATRQSESNLARLANATGAAGPGRRGAPPSANLSRPGPARLLSFLQQEHAAVLVNESLLGDGGTVFVAGAVAPGTNDSFAPTGPRGPAAYATNAPAMPPQLTLAAEDYNRLVRMLQQGVSLKMEVDLKVAFHDEDLMSYNTIAEIPGADLKDQIVMLGGHLDSWQSGTGATDNGVGAVAAMEAVRILQAAHLQPRRTIRIALWTGEEEGLLGSKAYVASHFGSYVTNAPLNPAEERTLAPRPYAAPSTPSAAPARVLVPGPEYDKLSAYFNLDNGAGKIRGIYMEANPAVRPIFAKWFEPFHSLGAQTLTLSRTGSTDHVSFDTIGLPGFQFIQDPLEYGTRSHHSNQDVFDRIQADDLKQAATILAAFVYDAAMLDQPIPRKPPPGPAGR